MPARQRWTASLWDIVHWTKTYPLRNKMKEEAGEECVHSPLFGIVQHLLDIMKVEESGCSRLGCFLGERSAAWLFLLQFSTIIEL